MMDWVKKFYNTQNDWFGIYLGDITKRHRQRVQLVHSLTDKTPKKILELGAGGGQTALALAEQGHELTMIELLEESCHHAHALAKHYQQPLHIINDDFYTVNLDQKFDVICYFDSFGIGADSDQQDLLQRIQQWLRPQGCAIIEVGSTWFWGGIANGQCLDIGDCMRKYEFDATQCRLIDKWWRPNKPEEVVYQSLRCYTPADLKLLLAPTALKIAQIQAGGTIDFEEMEFVSSAPLEKAMTYYVKLILK